MRANANVTFRPFESVFTIVGRVVLQGVRPRDVAALTTDSTGAIYAIDLSSRDVEKFGPDGKLLYVIRGPNWGRHQFQLPWSLACGDNDDIYILDIKTGEVSVFDKDGGFKSSLALAPQGLDGVTLGISPSSDVYVGAISILPKSNNPLLYKFGPDGKFLGSFFLQDPLVQKLNLTVVGGVFLDVDSSGDVFAVQPVSPRVFEFAPDGHLKRSFGQIPPFYQPPFKFPADLPSDRKKVSTLLDEWTEVQSVRVIRKEKLILLTYDVHSPVRYGLEIYREDGQLILGRIGSSLLPAFTNSLGHVCFYDPNAQTLTVSEFSVSVPKEHGI